MDADSKESPDVASYVCAVVESWPLHRRGYGMSPKPAKRGVKRCRHRLVPVVPSPVVESICTEKSTFYKVVELGEFVFREDVELPMVIVDLQDRGDQKDSTPVSSVPDLVP